MRAGAIPPACGRAFRSRPAGSGSSRRSRGPRRARAEAGTPPELDLVEASPLYQSLYWVARTAAVPTPETDVLLVTAAGWSAIPAIVHKALHGTPMILTEHGVYVREAYLAAVRSGDLARRAVHQHAPVARPGARCAYAIADVVCAGHRRQRLLGGGPRRPPGKIHVVHNGLRAAGERRRRRRGRGRSSRSAGSTRSRTSTRCCAPPARRCATCPMRTFLHYGPVTAGEEAYERSCRSLHAQLALGDRFRFMGHTTDPNGVVRDADVVLMSSISEALPMAILEAMGDGRPVVPTGVGGVRTS